MTAIFSNRGLRALALPVATREEAESQFVCKGMEETCVETDKEIAQLVNDLRRYFAGEPVKFAIELDLDGLTGWQKRVLMKAAEIPYGKVMTYGGLAVAVGSPGAGRAVGQAMARNPVPIVVPCHRVVAASGKLGGFSAGLDWKRKLLRLEGIEDY